MTYSGHETFHCRLFWLKKGLDYLTDHENFSAESGIELGVGKNMINSIRYWLRSFGVIDEQGDLSELYQALLVDAGWDPYLEQKGTSWLLHYKLCSTNHATIFRELFTELRKIKPEFSKEHFVEHAKRKNSKLSDSILGKDFSVFTRTYLDKDTDGDGITTGLLGDLNLLHELGKNYSGQLLYRIENRNPEELPARILLFSILDNPSYTKSIDFPSLYSDVNGPGNIFALTERDLEMKLEEITSLYSGVVYKNDAGTKELQFKTNMNNMAVLEDYYGG